MRKLPQRAESQDQNSMGWLTTFNDLVTLLMVFFVLVFTMSSIDAVKIKDFKTSLQSGLGVLEAGKQLAVGVTNALQPNQSPQSLNPSADPTQTPVQSETADRIEFTWHGERYRVPRPDTQGDVHYLWVNGVEVGPGALQVVLIRKKGLGERLRSLKAGGRGLALWESEAIAEPI